MRATELLNELKARGVVLQALGDRLRVGPRDRVPQELIAELRAHKSELLDLFGKPVRTPAGHGRLVADLPDRAVVRLDRAPSPFAVFLPAEVVPPQAELKEELCATVH